jgi:hypothetical protein
MKTYKYETHLHTSQGSACGLNTGAEMVDYYKSLGYAGFVVTDHFLNGNTAAEIKLPWEEAVTQFCSGYEDAKRRGGEVGFDVFFGIEYAFRGTEFLIYGLDKTWLLENPQIMKPDLKQALGTFREAGALIIHAHPFREAWYIDMFRLLPGFTDAVEVYNAQTAGAASTGTTHEQNEKAAIYAKMYGLHEIAGGDAHSNISRTAGIQTNGRIKSADKLLEIIRTGRFTLVKSS